MITKNYFYCLSTYNEKLDVDYIHDIVNSGKSISNIILKDFEVEVVDNDTGAVYNTNSTPGTVISDEGTTVNHWKILTIVRNNINSTEEVLNNVIGYYTGNSDEVYTRISDTEGYSGTGNIDSFVNIKGVSGTERVYKIDFNKVSNLPVGTQEVTYYVDFYLFLHVDGVAHPDSSIVVQYNSGNSVKTHPSLAIAKVTKSIVFYLPVKSSLFAQVQGTSGGSGDKTWGNYQFEDNNFKLYGGIFSAQFNNVGVGTLGSDWEVYVSESNSPWKKLDVGVNNHCTITTTVDGAGNSIVTLSDFTTTGVFFVIGKWLEGNSSPKTGANKKFEYVYLHARYSFGPYSDTDFNTIGIKLPEIGLSNNFETSNIKDTETSYITITPTSVNNGEVSYISSGGPYTRSITDLTIWNSIISRIYDSKIIIYDQTTGDILKSYKYLGYSQTIELPEGNWSIKLVNNFVAGDNYLQGHSETAFSTPEVLGNSDTIYALISERSTGEDSDLRFLKLHQSTLFSNIKYHKYYPLGAYHGAETPINIEDTYSFYGEEISTENTITQLTSPEQNKNLFSVVEFIGTIIENGVVENNNNDNYTDIHYTGPSANGSLKILNLKSDITNKSEGDIVIPAGSYRIVSTDVGIVTIDFKLLEDNLNTTNIEFTFTKYIWSEIYTTPFTLSEITSIDNNIIQITCPNAYKTPEVGDLIVLQYINENLDLNQSDEDFGTDGVDEIPVFSDKETYIFKIEETSPTINYTNISGVQVATSIDWKLTLDKSFFPGTGKYLSILLNRYDNTIHENLYSSLWNQIEIHRDQLIGDVYSGNGRKNYLNYEGREYSGFKNQIEALLPNNEGFNTPFIVLDFKEQLKDKISINEGNEVELVLPLLSFYNKKVPVFTNDLSPDRIFNDKTGIGTYTELLHKVKNEDGSRDKIGYVLHDLNLIVISDPEVVTALSYNSNRNFTLPQPVLQYTNQGFINYTKNNPLNIVSLTTNSSGVEVKTNIPHNLKVGDQVFIEDVLGVNSINTTPTYSLYVNKVSGSFSLNLKREDGPLLTSVSSYVQGTGIIYSAKPQYKYFVTYFVTNGLTTCLPYTTPIPFNFSNEVSLELTIPYHNSITSNELIGKVIIGEYSVDPTDSSIITGIKSVKVINDNDILWENQQEVSVTISYSNYLNNSVDYNLKVQKLFDLNVIPDTFFTGKPHVLIGNLKYKTLVDQFRTTFDIIVPVNKWNKSTNPTFREGDPLHNKKLITEIGLHVKNQDGTVDGQPVVYSKIYPPITKDNVSDLHIKMNIEF